MARLLVVAENRELRSTLRELLADDGHDVASAATLDEAVAALAGRPAERVFVDRTDRFASAVIAAAHRARAAAVAIGVREDGEAPADVELEHGCSAADVLAAARGAAPAARA